MAGNFSLFGGPGCFVYHYQAPFEQQNYPGVFLEYPKILNFGKCETEIPLDTMCVLY